MKLHADFDRVYAFEHRPRENLNHIVFMLAISIRRLDVDIKFVPCRFTRQGIFQAGNDISHAMQVNQRLIPN